MAIFVQGEYGIGKSSVANYIRAIAEKENGLHGVYVTLGRATSLEEVAAAILEGVLKSGAQVAARADTIRTWLGKYVKQVQLFGFSVNLEALKKDASGIATPHGILGLLNEAVKRLAATGVTGIMLILDEVNGITGNPLFAHLIKDLIETNATSQPPLPLLLMMCGIEARRNELIRNHPPVGRIFDIVAIDPMDANDT